MKEGVINDQTTEIFSSPGLFIFFLSHEWRKKES